MARKRWGFAYRFFAGGLIAVRNKIIPDRVKMKIAALVFITGFGL
jgi:hypothetical protein